MDFKKTNRNPPDALAQELEEFYEQYVQEIHDRMPLPIEMTNATGTRLDHLNDDCLLEIFSKNLTPMDLLSLAQTCKLFERIAPRSFPKKLAIDFSLKRDFVVVSRDSRVVIKESAQDVYKIFKIFGSKLDDLSVYVAADMMNLIANYCVGTLKELAIEATEITSIHADQMKQIFQQLRKLSIVLGSIECDSKVFANCDSLIELRIARLRNCNVILENYFPQLQRLSFYNFEKRYDLDLNLLLIFLERHKALKCLHFYGGVWLKSVDLLQAVGDSCKELEELDIAYHGTLDLSHVPGLKRLALRGKFPYSQSPTPTIVHLQKLKSLEDLLIGGAPVCYDNVFLSALPLLTNLRELSVTLGVVTEKIQWKLLSQLTKLHLLDCQIFRRCDDDITDIIRNLTKLQELDIDMQNVFLCVETIHEIYKVIKGRPHVLTLKCRLRYPDVLICDVESKLKIINKKR